MAYLDLSDEMRELCERVLTQRQLRVLQLRFSRVPWAQIADLEGIDPSTARGHWEAALRKLEKQPEIRKDQAA